MRLSGKVVLVTGAGSGIGHAAALAFGEAGARVMAVDIDADAAAQTAATISARGAEAAFHRADVASEPAVQRAVGECLRVFGALDCAFNNAGVGVPQAVLAESEEASLADVLRVNVQGVWACMKHELRHMRGTGSGVIVNTASALALRPRARLSLYGASKAAVVHLTRVAAAENADRGIRVNAVCPGPIMTPMLEKLPEGRLTEIAAGVPMGRLGSSTDISAAVVWLCTDAASYITGAMLPVDGGETA